jgi:hypothetical protein
MLDILYVNQKTQKKGRSRVEVALLSNFAPPVKPTRELPTEVLYLAARENRERILISQVKFLIMHSFKVTVYEC